MTTEEIRSGGVRTPDRAGIGSHARISRRSALRKGAVLAGTMVWVAPTVARVGEGPALAAGTPPPPDPTPPPPTFHGISYAAIVFTCDGKTWRGKWEGTWVDVQSLGSNPHLSLPHCDAKPDAWEATSTKGLPAPGYNNPDPSDPSKAVGVETTFVGGELHQVCFQLAEGCEFAEGLAGAVMGAGGDHTDQGYCVSGVVTNGNRRLCFTAPSL